MKSGKQYVNPPELFQGPSFSQAVITSGEGKTIYVGGQNAVDNKGELQGKGDLAMQTQKVLQNIEAALKACGAEFDDVVKLNIYLVQGQDPAKGFQASQEFMKRMSNPPVVTVALVASLGQPDYLVEIDAVAFSSK